MSVELLYIIVKIAAIVLIVGLAIVFLILSIQASTIKSTLKDVENKARQEWRRVLNIGGSVTAVLLQRLSTSSQEKALYWLNLLKYSKLAKYDALYAPLKSIICGLSELQSKVTNLKK